MNKVEAQQRILRNLAVIRYQVESLNRQGQNISAYTETAIGDSLIAVTGQPWNNLNALSNNFPALDLLSSDGFRAVQATAHTTKAKVDKTIAKLVNGPKTDSSPLRNLICVEVIGLTCARSQTVNMWQDIDIGGRSVQVRGIALEKALDLPHRTDTELQNLDQALQGLASTNPFHVRSDKDELKTIISYLDRPAIRDSRRLESDWHAMQEAMRSIRRLLGQGANDLGQQITRPYPTFQPVIAALLKDIYTETSAISVLLTQGLRPANVIQHSFAILLDGHRVRIQEKVTQLAIEAHLTPPTW